MPERPWEPCEMNRQEPQWVFEPARSSPWEPCGGDPTGPHGGGAKENRGAALAAPAAPQRRAFTNW